MYELLALGRNRGHFHLLSRTQLAEVAPGLDQTDCRGGVSYFDCAAPDFRLVIDTLKSSERHGAHLLNYAELEKVAGTDIGCQATIRDALSGRQHQAQSRCVVNATGPWADDVQSRLSATERFGIKLAIGIHLVVSRERLPVRETVALEMPSDGRMIYLVPWDRAVLIGTTDTYYSGDRNSLPVAADAIDYLLAGVNRYFPTVTLTAKDVLSSFRRRSSIVGQRRGEIRGCRFPRLRNHPLLPPGFWAITGGKLTTYRAMAERIVDKIVRDEFGDRRLGPCSTVGPIVGADRPMPGGASPPLQELWSRYGSEALAIDALIRESPELAEPIDDLRPLLLGRSRLFPSKRIRRANRRPHRPAARRFCCALGSICGTRSSAGSQQHQSSVPDSHCLAMSRP